jgi:transposase
MEYRHKLKDEDWEKIKDNLPGVVGKWGRPSFDNRRFINGVMWIARTGAPWRDLPIEFGKWSNVHKRFTRWSKKGIWQRIFNTLASTKETDWLMIDSTIVKVHQHASGGGKKGMHWSVQRRQDEQDTCFMQ